MKIPTVQERWREFEDKVVPKNASDIQKAEMRMSFVAGMLEASRLLNWAGESAGYMIEQEIEQEASKYTKNKSMEVYSDSYNNKK